MLIPFIAIYRTPYVMSIGGESNIKAAVDYWNQMLASRVATFTSSHPGSKTMIFDPTPVFNTILDAGGAAANCFNADGTTCLWADNFHPGLKIHDALAQVVANSLVGF